MKLSQRNKTSIATMWCPRSKMRSVGLQPHLTMAITCYNCHSYPRCSMYGIFAHIWVIYGVNVGICSIHGAYGYWSYVHQLNAFSFPGAPHCWWIFMDCEWAEWGHDLRLPGVCPQKWWWLSPLKHWNIAEQRGVNQASCGVTNQNGNGIGKSNTVATMWSPNLMAFIWFITTISIYKYGLW